MSETGKIIIASVITVIGSYGFYHFLTGVFRYLIERYFDGIDSKFKELYESRNEHENRLQRIEIKCDTRYQKKEYERGFIE